MKRILACLSALLLLINVSRLNAAPATLLFEDDFNRAIPGWTAIQPPGTYIDGPMRWQYDIVSSAYVENSNIYTDNAGASPSGTAVMLINDAVTTTPFTYKTRLTMGDDDGFGLVFGYENPTNVFRLTFSSQNNPIRTGYPWRGWSVDQKTNNVMVFLFGGGTAGYDTTAPSFLPVANRPFDVTISVSADNKLTLSIIDDALNNTTPVVLVDNQQLPIQPRARLASCNGATPAGHRAAFESKIQHWTQRRWSCRNRINSRIGRR
jgi:hypothetical protein